MDNLLYIKTGEEFTVIQPIPQSSDSDTVTVEILKISDSYTWNFTTEAFTSSSTTGNMTHVSGIIWKTTFTPDENDTYVVTVNDSTLDVKYVLTLIAVAGAETYGFVAQTKVGICNIALRLLGQDRISSLDENVEAARILNDIYDYVLKNTLRSHPWNFAIKRGSLAQLSATPEYGYSYQYQLPTDCLKVIEMSEDDAEWVIEGRKLLTDEDEATIQYIALITDPNEYDSNFVMAFAARLAAEMCYPITSNASLTEAKEAKALDVFVKAKGSDGQEGTPQAEDESSWLDARG